MAAVYTDSEGRRVRSSAVYSGLRKIIGTQMRQSLDAAPQAMISASMDMGNLLSVRSRLRDRGLRVTVTDLLIRVLGIALVRCPEVNAAVTDGRVVQYESVNIGVAVGTRRGLYVPVIREVQDRALTDISAELRRTAADLKAGIVDPSRLTGGTFTLSSLGMYDVEVCTPILRAPEAAILCVGGTKMRPVVLESGEIAARPMAVFSLTLDHAAMDGVPGAVFLRTVGEILAHPDLCLDGDGNYAGILPGEVQNP